MSENSFPTTQPGMDNPPALSVSDIITVSIYSVIGIIGVIGNVMVLIVFRLLKSRKSQVNSFILNQALADFTTSLLLITFGLTRIIRHQINHTGGFGEFLCRFWWSRFFVFSCFAVSTFNLTAMSVERFIAVVLPLKYPFIFTKRRTYSIILVVWLIAPGMQWIFPIALYELDKETNSCKFQASWSFQVAGAISGVFLFLWEYFVPVTFMLIAYISILKTLKRKEVQIQGLSQTKTENTRSAQTASSVLPTRQKGIRFNVENNSNDDKRTKAPKPKATSAQVRRRNVTITLFIMFLVYVICWTPNQLTFLQFNLGGALDFNGAWYHITVFMAFLNTCVNPIIYALKHKQFQKGMKEIFHCYGNRVDQSSLLSNSVSGTAVD